MAIDTGLVELLNARVFYAHMWIVAVDAGEIELRIVGFYVFIRTKETRALLESLGLAGHHKRAAFLCFGHKYGKYGIQMHPRYEIRELLATFEHVVAL